MGSDHRDNTWLAWLQRREKLAQSMFSQASQSCQSPSIPPPAALPNSKGIVPGDLVVVKTLTEPGNSYPWTAASADGKSYLKVGDAIKVYSVDTTYGSTKTYIVYHSPGHSCIFGINLQCLLIDMVDKLPNAPGVSMCGVVTVSTPTGRLILGSNQTLDSDQMADFINHSTPSPAEAECKCRSLLWGHERGC